MVALDVEDTPKAKKKKIKKAVRRILDMLLT